MSRPFPSILIALLVAAAAGRTAHADVDPVLTINGQTGDNTTVAALPRLGPLEIRIDGTPGAPFALLLSLGADTQKTTGFFLQRHVEPGISSPIHPVFDGIGAGFLEQALGLPPGDLLAVPVSPLFVIPPSGSFVLKGLTPPLAVLVDEDPQPPFGPSSPIVLPLEPGAELFLQVVAVDTQTLDLRVGNGMKITFEEPALGATIAYSQSPISNSSSDLTLPTKQSLGTLSDSDLGAGPMPTFSTAQDFSGAFADNVDLWAIALGGRQEMYPTSIPADGMSPVDNRIKELQGYPSSLEFLTGSQPARDNENFEFPVIVLPGNRVLFHWRALGVGLDSMKHYYGFGILFRDTMTWRNLTPPTVPQFEDFTESPTRSPWEVEVAVTPDGNRAVAILDRSADSFDRIFLLNLEEDLQAHPLANGSTIIEIQIPFSNDFRRVWEEGIRFLKDTNGNWVGLIPSTTSSSTSETITPNRLYRFNAQTGSGTALKVLPGGPFLTIAHIDRVGIVNEDRTVFCTIAGPSQTAEQVFAVSNVTPFSHSLIDTTAFPGNTVLADSFDVSDGVHNYMDLSKNGSVFAGAIQFTSSERRPIVTRTDGSKAGTIQPLVKDQNQGGLFDLDDFEACNELHLTDDGGHLLFHQGVEKGGATSDWHDLFVANLSSGQILNLTRTLGGPNYEGDTPLAYFGPWDVANPTEDHPNIDPGGVFRSFDRRWLFEFVDRTFSNAAIDAFNLIAISIGDDPILGEPTFEIVNVTGNEFEPSFGAPVPGFGAPNIVVGGFLSEKTANGLFVRRAGGTGPLADFYFMTATVKDEGAGQHLFAFDGTDPGPAVRLTQYSSTSSPIAASDKPGIRNVTVSPHDAKVAYVLQFEVTKPKDPNHELVVQDLNHFAVPMRIPDGAVTFDRAVLGGGVRWIPGVPGGLVYAAGHTPRPKSGGVPATDGVTTDQDPFNPIDPGVFFVDFLDPSTEVPLVPALGANEFRQVAIYGVKAP